jgi:hypothetical protein
MQKTLPGLTPEMIAKLRSWSIKGAARMGEEHPTHAIILSTTRRHFFEKTGDAGGGEDFDAFIVQYRGDFTAGFATRPAGTAAPRGTSTYTVYRAHTLKAWDWGLSNHPFDPEAIGPWIPLDLED